MKKTAQSNITSAESHVLKHARVTEKAAKANVHNVYVFDVTPTATKSQIIKAFKAIYKHAPIKVNTVSKKPKSRSKRTASGTQTGFSAKGKIAYVYLKKGTTIDVT